MRSDSVYEQAKLGLLAELAEIGTMADCRDGDWTIARAALATSLSGLAVPAAGDGRAQISFPLSASWWKGNLETLNTPFGFALEKGRERHRFWNSSDKERTAVSVDYPIQTVVETIAAKMDSLETLEVLERSVLPVGFSDGTLGVLAEELERVGLRRLRGLAHYWMFRFPIAGRVLCVLLLVRLQGTPAPDDKQLRAHRNLAGRHLADWLVLLGRFYSGATGTVSDVSTRQATSRLSTAGGAPNAIRGTLTPLRITRLHAVLTSLVTMSSAPGLQAGDEAERAVRGAFRVFFLRPVVEVGPHARKVGFRYVLSDAQRSTLAALAPAQVRSLLQRALDRKAAHLRAQAIREWGDDECDPTSDSWLQGSARTEDGRPERAALIRSSIALRHARRGMERLEEWLSADRDGVTIGDRMENTTIERSGGVVVGPIFEAGAVESVDQEFENHPAGSFFELGRLVEAAREEVLRGVWPAPASATAALYDPRLYCLEITALPDEISAIPLYDQGVPVAFCGIDKAWAGGAMPQLHSALRAHRGILLAAMLDDELQAAAERLRRWATQDSDRGLGESGLLGIVEETVAGLLLFFSECDLEQRSGEAPRVQIRARILPGEDAGRCPRTPGTGHCASRNFLGEETMSTLSVCAHAEGDQQLLVASHARDFAFFVDLLLEVAAGVLSGKAAGKRGERADLGAGLFHNIAHYTMPLGLFTEFAVEAVERRDFDDTQYWLRRVDYFRSRLSSFQRAARAHLVMRDTGARTLDHALGDIWSSVLAPLTSAMQYDIKRVLDGRTVATDSLMLLALLRWPGRNLNVGSSEERARIRELALEDRADLEELSAARLKELREFQEWWWKAGLRLTCEGTLGDARGWEEVPIMLEELFQNAVKSALGARQEFRGSRPDCDYDVAIKFSSGTPAEASIRNVAAGISAHPLKSITRPKADAGWGLYGTKLLAGRMGAELVGTERDIEGGCLILNTTLRFPLEAKVQS